MMGKETVRLKTNIFLIKILQFQNEYVLLDVMNKQLQQQQKERNMDAIRW